MNAIPIELERAAEAARDRLVSAARTAAAAGTGGRLGAHAAMAGAARAAIFADALTAAMHARLEELKGAAK